MSDFTCPSKIRCFYPSNQLFLNELVHEKVIRIMWPSSKDSDKPEAVLVSLRVNAEILCVFAKNY